MSSSSRQQNDEHIGSGKHRQDNNAESKLNEAGTSAQENNEDERLAKLATALVALEEKASAAIALGRAKLYCHLSGRKNANLLIPDSGLEFCCAATRGTRSLIMT